MAGPLGFPTWTALSGIAGFLALSVLRQWLAARSEPATAKAARWQMNEIVLLLVAIAIALVLRMYGLGDRPLDNDEPASLGLCSLDVWATDADARLHPPLAALLMGLGAGCRMDVDVGRSVSALAGIATVALVFAIARARAGKHAAFFAALFIAVAPAAIRISQLARGYALLALLVLAAHACLSRALDTGKGRWWFAYSLTIALALATEYIALAPLLADAALAIVVARKRRSALTALVGSFGAGAAASGWMLGFAVPTLTLGVGGPTRAPSGVLSALVDIAGASSGALPWVVLVLPVGLVIATWDRKSLGAGDARLIASILAIVTVIAVGGALTAMRPRYALHALPMVAILASTAAFRAERGGGFVALLVYALSHVALLPGYLTGTSERRELHFAEPIPRLLARVRGDPRPPVVVLPAPALAEVSWRLGRTLPGPDSGTKCPFALCARGEGRRYYGSDDPRSLSTLDSTYVIDRGGLDLGPACRKLDGEADAVLYFCAR